MPPERAGWHPAQRTPSKSIIYLAAFAPSQRQSPLRKSLPEIPMQVTLDPVYCTLAIEAGRHRQTFRRRGRTASDVQIRMK